MVPEQFGYKKAMSIKNTNYKRTVYPSLWHFGGIFLWFCKFFSAFKSLNFLAQLHFYGLQGQGTRLQSYLTGRKQNLLWNHLTMLRIFSYWGILKQVVPHSSVLGPLHFIIDINNLPPTLSLKTQASYFLVKMLTISLQWQT